MASVIDIDLDYLMNETIYHPFGVDDAGSRRDWNEYGTWLTLSELLATLESLGVPVHTLPRAKVDKHHEVLRVWEEYLQSGILSSPFHIFHFDAHSDLYRRPASPSQSVPDETNFLWWAILRRWAASITWVVPDPQLTRIWTSKGLSGPGISPAEQGIAAPPGHYLSCPSDWKLRISTIEVPLYVVAIRDLKQLKDVRCLTVARSPNYTCEKLDIEYEALICGGLRQMWELATALIPPKGETAPQ